MPRISVDLDALAGRYGLPPAAVDQLRGLVEAIASDPLAPTAIRDPDDVLRRHVADSLVALELPLLTSPIHAVDLGSGAGFPGMVLAVARPDSQLVLLESTARKGGFMERTAAACSISNVDVVQARAETWPDGLARFDVATARALGPLPVVLEYAAPLLRLGGSVIAWRGRREPATESAAAAAALELGLELGEVRRVVPFPGAEHRHLHLARKIAETPPRFPRRAGMAAKRPLGSRGDNPSDRARR